MTQSFFRALFASLAATVMFVATPAPAATLTFTDNNCASFAVTGSAPNFTLVCQSLSCTLSASPAAPTPSQGVTMTASCSGGTGAITFSNWLSATAGCPAVNGAGASGTIPAPGGAVGPCTYRVTGTDTANLTGTASANVTWSSTPPAAPSGCTLTANPSSMAAAGNVTLTANCLSGGAPTTYAWTGPGVTTPTASSSQIVNVTATTTFGVTPSNATGPGNTASAGVTVGGGGGGGLPATCTIGGVSYNVLDVGTMSPDGARTTSSGFTGSKVVIATLVPPGGLSTNTNTISVFEYGGDGSTHSRKAWLAKSPCDTSGTWPAYEADTGPVFNYSIGGFDSSAVNMKVGETWYLIIVNQKPFGGNSCTSGACDIGIKWYRPF
jgi:hypothetical protein